MKSSGIKLGMWNVRSDLITLSCPIRSDEDITEELQEVRWTFDAYLTP